MPTPLYCIPNWGKQYENNRSRILRKLDWVMVPNAHDGDGYSGLMARADAPILFTAWILLLQVASKCEPRGTLIRSNGEPHTPESLATRTRGAPEWFETALPFLVKIGWLSCNMPYTKDTAPACHLSGTLVPPKGREGKGREDIYPSSAPPMETAIYELYPRKVGKADALKAIRHALKTCPNERLHAQTSAYAAAVASWPTAERQFIPHPATWFNRGSYDDDPETWKRHEKPNIHQRANDRSYSQVDDYSKYRPPADGVATGP